MDFTSQTMAIKKFKVKFLCVLSKIFQLKIFLYFIHYLFVTSKLSVRFSIFSVGNTSSTLKVNLSSTQSTIIFAWILYFFAIIVQQVGLEDSVELHVLAV